MKSSDGPFGNGRGDDPLPPFVEHVAAVWTALLSGAEPWRHMPLDDQRGQMRRLLTELLDSTGEPLSPARVRRLRAVAMRHGVFRRCQGCDENILVEEFRLIPPAVREALLANGVRPAVAREISRTLLPECRIARQAAWTVFATMEE